MFLLYVWPIQYGYYFSDFKYFCKLSVTHVKEIKNCNWYRTLVHFDESWCYSVITRRFIGLQFNYDTSNFVYCCWSVIDGVVVVEERIVVVYIAVYGLVDIPWAILCPVDAKFSLKRLTILIGSSLTPSLVTLASCNSRLYQIRHGGSTLDLYDLTVFILWSPTPINAYKFSIKNPYQVK